jgi:hypothetical protein
MCSVGYWVVSLGHKPRTASYPPSRRIPATVHADGSIWAAILMFQLLHGVAPNGLICLPRQSQWRFRLVRSGFQGPI